MTREAITDETICAKKPLVEADNQRASSAKGELKAMPSTPTIPTVSPLKCTCARSGTIPVKRPQIVEYVQVTPPLPRDSWYRASYFRHEKAMVFRVLLESIP